MRFDSHIQSVLKSQFPAKELQEITTLSEESLADVRAMRKLLQQIQEREKG